MILYLDTSALVKLYVREVGSVRVRPLLDDQRLKGGSALDTASDAPPPNSANAFNIFLR